MERNVLDSVNLRGLALMEGDVVDMVSLSIYLAPEPRDKVLSFVHVARVVWVLVNHKILTPLLKNKFYLDKSKLDSFLKELGNSDSPIQSSEDAKRIALCRECIEEQGLRYNFEKIGYGKCDGCGMSNDLYVSKLA